MWKSHFGGNCQFMTVVIRWILISSLFFDGRSGRKRRVLEVHWRTFWKCKYYWNIINFSKTRKTLKITQNTPECCLTLLAISISFYISGTFWKHLSIGTHSNGVKRTECTLPSAGPREYSPISPWAMTFHPLVKYSKFGNSKHVLRVLPCILFSPVVFSGALATMKDANE